jgi:uncharacterized lipoprotein YajG
VIIKGIDVTVAQGIMENEIAAILKSEMNIWKKKGKVRKNRVISRW